MKLMCKCGNIEELKSDSKTARYEIKNCSEGTLALICKECKAVVLIEFEDK